MICPIRRIAGEPRCHSSSGGSHEKGESIKSNIYFAAELADCPFAAITPERKLEQKCLGVSSSPASPGSTPTRHATANHGSLFNAFFALFSVFEFLADEFERVVNFLPPSGP